MIPFQRHRYIIYHIILICLCVSIIGGCRQKYRQAESARHSGMPDQEQLLRTNQLMIRKNADAIREAATVNGWHLTETGTGVFYQVIRESRKGRESGIKAGDGVRLAYKLTLLDGTQCYSSDKMGPKQFIVEKSEAESGLHEVIKLLLPGDSVLIVLPPHRAFGLAGDGDRIPPQSILVYQIRIDSVFRKRNN